MRALEGSGSTSQSGRRSGDREQDRDPDRGADEREAIGSLGECEIDDDIGDDRDDQDQRDDADPRPVDAHAARARP